MKILIIGSGGREHALAWKIKQSEHCEQLYCAPGNPGTAVIAENIDVSSEDLPALKEYLLSTEIDLLIVGPEAPLVAGIREELLSSPGLENLLIVGPGKQGAMLEGSKEFAKQFMQRHQIPTASYRSFNSMQVTEAVAYLDEVEAPYVLKADGLAAGKGVSIHRDVADARRELRALLQGKFGPASQKVIVEQFLEGIELSVFVLTDGMDYVLLPEAKDYKRIGEGDTGPNTGGMGAISPVPFADEALMQKIETRIIQPTISGLRAEGIDYRGFIFFGLIKVGQEPYVIEYNVRMGDPETQAVLPRIASDLVPVLAAAARGELANATLEIKSECAATVVAVAPGYPGAYEKGAEITLDDLPKQALLFHAGTRFSAKKLSSAGGRVVAVTGLGADLKAARRCSYQGMASVRFQGMNYRKDIGADLT